MRLAEIREASKFHGGYIGDKKRPIFFTDDLKIASQFVDFAPDPNGEYIVYEANLTMLKPAGLKHLRAAIKAVNATENDIDSAYDDIDESDFLFVPKVVDELKKQGFDSFKGRGVYDSFMINEYVIFDINQMHVIALHKVT